MGPNAAPGDRIALWVDIVFLVACVGLGAWGLASRPGDPRPKIVPHRVGDTIRVPGIDFSKADRTLLLFILDRQSTKESLAFYAGLTAMKRDSHQVRVIALLGEGYDLEASNAHLHEDGVMADDAVKVNLQNLRIRDLPTVILVDRNGTVLRLWRLQIGATEEREIVNALKLQPQR
jgi:hypothetical protein